MGADVVHLVLRGRRQDRRLRGSKSLTALCVVGLSFGMTSAALANCAAPNSIVECTGDTPTTGYGDGTQTNLVIHVNPKSSVSGGTTATNAGMELGAGNSILNEGAITGNASGITAAGALGVQNTGTLTGKAGSGIVTTGTGALTLTNSGTLQGTTAGYTSAGTANVTNAGSILGGTMGGTSVGDLSLTNTGLIQGTSVGLNAGQDPGSGNATIVNSGLIQATSASGTSIRTGGVLTLTNTGQVVGGISSYAGADITNNGQINGNSTSAISTFGNVKVTNKGSITTSANLGGGISAISSAHDATIINNGTLSVSGPFGTTISSSTLTLTNTGTVAASNIATAINTQQNATITNTNVISAGDDSTAIRTGGDLTLVNKGSVSVGSATVPIYTTTAISVGGVATITNTGNISTGPKGATTAISSTGALTLANSGSVSTQGAGSTTIAGASNTNVTNAGSLQANGLGSTTLKSTGNTTVVNTGTMSGDVVILTGGKATITNKGAINAGTTAVQAAGDIAMSNTGTLTGLTGILSGGSIVLDNSNSIATSGKGSVAVSALNAISLTNSGTISGETGIQVTGLAPTKGSSITNTGKIIGTGGTAIQLSNAADIIDLGANSIIGGAIKTGGGGDTITIDGSGRGAKVIAFDTLTNAKVTVTGTDHYAIVGNSVVIADNSSQRVQDRSIADVRESIGDLTHGRLNSAAQRTAADPLGGLWIQGFGSASNQQASGTNYGASTRHGGAIGGFEDNTVQSLHVGVFAGGAIGTGTDKGTGDAARGTYALGGGYARWSPNVLVVEADFVGGMVSNATSRTLVTNLSNTGTDTTKGTTKGHFISPSLGIGVKIALDDVTTLTPGLRVRYLSTQMNSETETGAVSAVSITDGARSSRNLDGRVQVEAEHKVRFANGTLSFFETIGVLGQNQTGSSSSMIIQGADLTLGAPTAARVWGGFGSAAFEWRNATGTSLYASLQGEWHNDRTLTAKGRAGAMWRF